MGLHLDSLKGPFCSTKCTSYSLSRASSHETVLDCNEEINLSLTSDFRKKLVAGSEFKKADVCGP